MIRLQPNWINDGKSSACGENVSLSIALKDLRSVLDRIVPGPLPKNLIIQVKAIVCEFPAVHQVSLPRWSTADIARYACQSGLIATISDSTVWRWLRLNEDAIRPWQHRSWIFPRDPQFALKAGQILDLYPKVWNGSQIKDDEFVLCADEKTSIRAWSRRQGSYPTQPDSPMKVEHEYKRLGAWAYIAALDVHRMKLLGRCEHKSGITSFDRLVDQVMTQLPYRDARKVFWIVDNGSCHGGSKSAARLKEKYTNLVLIHGPVHASWLNQIEIYFSILQIKALTPNDFPSIQALEERVLNFQRYHEEITDPFEWKFTRKDLDRLISKIKTPWDVPYRQAA